MGTHFRDFVRGSLPGGTTVSDVDDTSLDLAERLARIYGPFLQGYLYDANLNPISAEPLVREIH